MHQIMSDVAEPIPAPSRLPRALYKSTSGTQLTLKEQMHLKHSPEKFKNFLRVMRATAARHIDLTLSHKWQDAHVLEKIKQNILAQCPELGRHYVNAWPIVSYFRLSLKSHNPKGYQYQHLTRPRRAARQHTETTVKNVTPNFVVRSRSPKIFTRNLSTANRKTNRGYATAPHHISNSVDGTRKTNHLIDHTENVHLSGTTTQERSQPLNPRTGIPSCPVVFINCNPQKHRARPSVNTRSASLGERAIRSAGITGADINPRYPARTIPPDGPMSVSAATGPPATVRDMLLAHALPRADADRIALLLAGKGIASVAYLRVFAVLKSREAWLLDMCGAGLLSEVQARVVSEMLDTIALG
ncbi:hypothetical protein BC628DRAFT_1341711 [Trametes gibbosa]|nr:hypothetical protein BC628DRAFT_1341711 [Trametes gibbosa]